MFIKKNKDQNKWLNLSIFIVGLMKNEKLWEDERDKGYEVGIVNWENFERPVSSDSSLCPLLFRGKDASFFHI